MQEEKQRYWLTFRTGTECKPLIWEMSRKFDLVFNIRGSSTTGGVGLMAIELEGPHERILRAVRWFERRGVEVSPVELSAIEG